MLIVDDALVSDDLLAEEFVCNLRACRGACCHVGDYGAPLTADERTTLEDIYPAIRAHLTPQGRAEIAARGLYEWVDDPDARGGGEYATTCLDGGACVFMTRTADGIAACGIEQAWRAGATGFRKPISCHLYPVRVESDPTAGFEALNYNRWEICSAACAHGREHRVPVFRFVRDAIVRRWGEGFYEQLEAAYAAGHTGDPEPRVGGRGEN